MKGDDRRELILDAAMEVFGDYGYVGTTTAAVARAAGVSQPYVVRMFGTKQQLFLDVLRRAVDILLASFRSALADDDGTTVGLRLGTAYFELASTRGLLLSLMHAFVLGRDPVIGAAAREGFMCVYRFLRDDAGLAADEVQAFLSSGMLINTVVGLRMADDYDANADVRELIDAAFPQKLDIVLDLRESNA
jgi:TetR/AcrR family transcriptional regulator